MHKEQSDSNVPCFSVHLKYRSNGPVSPAGRKQPSFIPCGSDSTTPHRGCRFCAWYPTHISTASTPSNFLTEHGRPMSSSVNGGIASIGIIRSFALEYPATDGENTSAPCASFACGCDRGYTCVRERARTRESERERERARASNLCHVW
jgi:hypothetical protein